MFVKLKSLENISGNIYKIIRKKLENTQKIFLNLKHIFRAY